MSKNVDLRQLAVRREENSAPPRPRRRNWLTRYVLPGVVLLGFGGVIAWAARDNLLSSKPVTVVPVLTTRAEVQAEGTPLFQSAGWVEPRPTSVLVTALAEGVVEKLLVVEGDPVKKGDPIARLIDEDARLALRSAEADLRLRKAELASARAAQTAARTNLAKPVQLQAALAEAQALVAQKRTELTGLPFQLEAARARVKVAEYDHEVKQRSGGAVPLVQVRQAVRELETAQAVVKELEAKQTNLQEEVKAQEQRRDALEQRLSLKTDETRARDESDAQVDASEAREQQAQAALEAAKLRLDRMTVKAPISGRVLALVARPGLRLMGLAPGAMYDSSTVVSLYDPALLQVRADVRLEDVPRVVPGQRVLIDTPAAPDGPVEGVVLKPTSVADIQKNTLQVKVAIEKPPTTLRPEMLVQVTFLAPPTTEKKGPGEVTRLLVPRSLVEEGTHVWVVDQAGGVARKKSVKLGVMAGELVEVVEGITQTDRVIAGGREGLRDGQRVKITGEEAPTTGTPHRGRH